MVLFIFTAQCQVQSRIFWPWNWAKVSCLQPKKIQNRHSKLELRWIVRFQLNYYGVNRESCLEKNWIRYQGCNFFFQTNRQGECFAEVSGSLMGKFDLDSFISPHSSSQVREFVHKLQPIKSSTVKHSNAETGSKLKTQRTHLLRCLVIYLLRKH